jgi:uncharacterized protein YaiL (DUF2058 family)
MLARPPSSSIPCGAIDIACECHTRAITYPRISLRVAAIMSTSLRDQLLQAGLVSQKQVKDAERQQQRHTQQLPKHKRGNAAAQQPAPVLPVQRAKSARDQELNRQQHDKAKKKALKAQIKQLIDQNRLPQIEGDDFYNFVDGSKIRHIAVDPAVRGGLSRGEIMIVRHEGRYYLVPAAPAARIRERDDSAVIARTPEESSAADDAYAGFPVPDDLTW